MNRILHCITAVICGLACFTMFMLAGLDTVSMPDWAYLLILPGMPLSLCLCLSEAGKAGRPEKG